MPGRSVPATRDILVELEEEAGFTGLDMMAVRKRGQNPYFWYKPTCLALCAKVNSPTWRVFQAAKISIVESSRRCPIARPQYSGAMVSGPKNPTLPQLAAKFDPTTRPSSSAASPAPGFALHRVRT